MKTCPNCKKQLEDNARFCLSCGTEYREPAPEAAALSKPAGNDKQAEAGNPLFGDKNLINDSTIIGKQEKYEASNITINNTVTEDHSHTTVVCAVSGKRIYMDNSVVCPECNQPVSMEYYVEQSKRCERCEEKAREAFRAVAARITAEGPLNASRKERIDAEARKLRIATETQNDILRSLQRRTPATGGKLTSVQEADLETAVKQLMRLDDPKAQRQALDSLAALHDLTGNYTVDYWLYLGRTTVRPDEAVRSYEEEVVDNYWQRYWGYLAYCITGSPRSGAAIERLRTSFSDHEDDIRLAETAYCLTRGLDTADRSMMKHAGDLAVRIRPEYLSQPLAPVFATMKRVLSEGISLDAAYTDEERFVLQAVFQAGKHFERLRAEAEEQARKEREEKRRRELQAREEEKRRQEKQAQLAADRNRRMEEEVARLNGTTPNRENRPGTTKAFAGYEAEVPNAEKSGKWTRRLLIAVGVIILILIALFLIPAPESLQ